MKFTVMRGLGVAIALADNKTLGKFDPKNVTLPVDPVPTKTELGPVPQIVSWGDDNLFPSKLQSIIRKNSKLRKGLALTAAELLAGGVRTGKLMYDEQDGEEWFQPMLFPEFREWERLAESRRQYAMLASRNLKTYFNAFVAVVLTPKGDQIALLKTIPASTCRLSAPRPDGSHEFVYISTYWDEGVRPDNTEKVTRIRLLPDWWDQAGVLRYLADTTGDRQFMLHLRIPTDELTYSLPDWYSVVEQGWVDVANNVPLFKTWMMKNITDVDHVMYVRPEYFEMQYPEWTQWESKAQRGDEESAKKIVEAQEELLSYIEQKLTGLQNAGKLLSIPLLRGAIKDLSAAKSIIIEKVEKNNYDGKFNIDVQEADTQVLFALGIDPSRYGSQPGSSRQGGSDKREAHNIGQVMEESWEYILLTPYRILRDFNGFDSEMEFQIRRSQLQTLDQVNATDRQTSPTV